MIEVESRFLPVFISGIIVFITVIDLACVTHFKKEHCLQLPFGTNTSSNRGFRCDHWHFSWLRTLTKDHKQCENNDCNDNDNSNNANRRL